MSRSASPSRLRSMRSRTICSRARSARCRPAPARNSRSCRRRTRPAISSRSCSVFRCGSISTRTTGWCRKLKAGMSVYVDHRHRSSPLAGRAARAAVGGRHPRAGLKKMSASPPPSMAPGLRRNMVTICAMTATIMQALDTTIANVALPYMQGTLSASQDQINWVLTSYIVAAAIMTAPVGWIANRFGRKTIFIICSARLHRGLGVLRAGAGHQPDGAVSSAAGRVRRRAGAAVAGGDARLLRAARTGQGDVDLGHGRDDGTDHGPVTWAPG